MPRGEGALLVRGGRGVRVRDDDGRRPLQVHLQVLRRLLLLQRAQLGVVFLAGGHAAAARAALAAVPTTRRMAHDRAD